MTIAEFSVLLFVFKERLIERKVTAATVVLYLFNNLVKINSLFGTQSRTAGNIIK